MNNQWNWNWGQELVTPPETKFYANGSVSDLPGNMLNDQFGVAGFVVGQKATHSHNLPLPDTIAKEVMVEMTKENEEKEKSWTEKFSGPISKPSEPSVFSVEPEVPLPAYLVTNRAFQDPHMSAENLRKMLSLKADKFSNDLLFFMFYSFPRDVLQLVAAQHLYKNGWRYHIEAQIWLHRLPMFNYERELDCNGKVMKERGVYEYFNYREWKIGQVKDVIDFSKLEGQPSQVDLSSVIFAPAGMGAGL